VPGRVIEAEKNAVPRHVSRSWPALSSRVVLFSFFFFSARIKGHFDYNNSSKLRVSSDPRSRNWGFSLRIPRSRSWGQNPRTKPHNGGGS